MSTILHPVVSAILHCVICSTKPITKQNALSLLQILKWIHCKLFSIIYPLGNSLVATRAVISWMCLLVKHMTLSLLTIIISCETLLKQWDHGVFTLKMLQKNKLTIPQSFMLQKVQWNFPYIYIKKSNQQPIVLLGTAKTNFKNFTFLLCPLFISHLHYIPLIFINIVLKHSMLNKNK